MIVIEETSAVSSKVLKEYRPQIKPSISWDFSYYRKKGFGKKRYTYQKDMFLGDTETSSYFWTGLIPRVVQYLKLCEVPVTVHPISWGIQYVAPNLPGITFRDDQLVLLQSLAKYNRGVILAPTGSGKTILAGGVISMIPDATVLFLVHRKSIFSQTLDEFRKFGFSDYLQPIGEGCKELPNKPIVVAMVQTFKKYDPDTYRNSFDCVIVDEAHHISKQEGQYSAVLRNLKAPIRLGFTATYPVEAEAIFTLEGLIGPPIGEVTRSEGIELGIIATPKIKLIKLPNDRHVKSLNTYKDVYDRGVVHNRRRNRKILQIAKEYVDNGKSVLIVVERIEHGQELYQLANNIHRIPTAYVFGATKDFDRDAIKNAFIEKQIPCVVTNNTWGEGVNIPTIDVVINGVGGRSEIRLLQIIGRGMRKTKEKDEVLIIDFFDPSHHYLISHFGERVTLYMDEGWL